ncbi:actin-binding protein IPP-like isoform X2 [Centruroides sculpturatus]|uniref:actin-binding protein IPP-like isoform X2 n=1 Tax=Centruroides sculpturatus TaxID=218467 RepID=UPI000C6DD88E|nr:actin-binding protein IPP-like isoform X2 [Centruroides sculpturatus]
MENNSTKIKLTSMTEESLRRLLSDDEVSTSDESTDKNFITRDLDAKSFSEKKLSTDIFIYINDECYQAHSSVLCHHSLFLKKLLTGNRKEKKYIKILKLQPSIFEALLHFMYTGQIRLSCNVTYELLTAAKKLEIKTAVRKIYQIISEELDEISKLFYIYVISKQCGIQKKWLLAYETILKRFEESVLCLEFLNLEVEEICEILSGDCIAARREKYAIRVVSCVRFSMMTLDEILACYHPPILQDIVHIPEIRAKLLTSTCYVAAKNLGMESEFEQFSSLPRTYTVGGKIHHLY